jgi:hypothetical protein
MNSTNATNLYDLLFKLKTQLENRLKLEFFGSKIKENLKYFSEDKQNNFLSNARNAYKRAIDYLIKNFDFDSSPFKLFSSLNLDNDLNYENLIEIKKLLNIYIDEDLLFDEITSFNALLNQINVKQQLNVISKYCKILRNKEFNNLSKIIETVMFIPIGNDFVERVFSHLRRIWTDERSSMGIDLIKAEICIRNNFNMDCIAFKSYVKNNENS